MKTDPNLVFFFLHFQKNENPSNFGIRVYEVPVREFSTIKRPLFLK